MGIKFKQIDNLQNTFDSVSGNLQQEITSNSDAVSGIASGEYTFEGDKHFSNNVNFSGAQGILVNSDNIYTPNSIFADSIKIGYPLSDPRNSTPSPLGALQVSGGQIYLEDQLNIRNNSSINIEAGFITGLGGDLDSVTGQQLNYQTGDFSSQLTVSGNPVSTGVIIDYQTDSGVSLIGETFVTQGTGNFDSIDFNPTAGLPYKEGRLFYDSDNFTLSLYNEESDVSLQIGQETYLRVRNNTIDTISNGATVRIESSQGTYPTVELASANSESNSQVIGLATQDIAPSSFGYVTTYGIVRGINTTGYSAGDEIRLSVNSGEFTSGDIVSPNYRVSVGHVIRSHQNQGSVLVQVGQPKLGGGDVKNLKTANVSGVPFFEQAIDGAGILCSSNNFVFDSGNTRLGIGTTEPQGILDMSSTSSAPVMPRMNDSQMNGIPSPVNGMIIYNTTSGKFAGYAGGSWTTLH